MEKKSHTAKLFSIVEIFLGWIFLICLFTFIYLLYAWFYRSITTIWFIVFGFLCVLTCIYSVFMIRAFDKAEKEQDKLIERLENIENKLNNETKENL